MNELNRIVKRTAAIACFTIGSLLFLSETRSTGEESEQFKLAMSTGPVSIGGAVLMVLGVAGYALLYLSERRKHLEPL